MSTNYAPPRVDSTKRSFPLTDSGNAEQFAAEHGENVRFCHAWNKWLVWDGRRWKIDDTGEVERLALATVRAMYRKASDIDDQSRRTETCKHALRSESASRRAAMLRLAQSEQPIPIRPEELDTDPWLLNCENGTLDLRSGELREHRREDFITKLAPVEYDPVATAPTWEAFLDRVFRGDRELIRFIQRVLGYGLTGDVSEQVLVIFYGTGANGKSTLLEAIMRVLGDDYSVKAPRDLLVARRNAHPTELTVLHGRRLVVSTETEDQGRFAESLVKELTGGDTISARRMHEDFWQFKPTHKIVLATNHKPIVWGTDCAIWRRIVLVPFEVTIPEGERDRELAKKLDAERAGILAWCVQGCRDWQEHGLQRPAAVQRATHTYRAEQDTLQEFFAETCVFRPDAKVNATELFLAYQAWSGDKSTTLRRFGLMLEERGLPRKMIDGKVFRVGIGLAAA